MANIKGTFETGQTLAAGPDIFKAYGPYLFVQVTGGRATLTDAGKATVAVASTTTTKVNLPAIAPGDNSIPYINKFIAPLKVETYWRTGELRVRGGGARTRAAKPKQAAPVQSGPVATAPAPAPVVVAAQVAVAPTPAPAPVLVAPKPAPKALGVKFKSIAGQDVAILPGGIVVDARHYRTIANAWKTRSHGGLATVSVTGPSGTAKTVMVRAFAESIGVRMVTMQGITVEVATDWFGGLRQMPDGRWDFVLTEVGQALVDGEPVIILLDEANRAQSAGALNAILSLTDSQKSVYVQGYGTLTLPDGVMLVLTANVGSEYVGTQQFDAAVRQRFGAWGIRLDYPNEQVETGIVAELTGLDKAEAERLVNMANQQRPLRSDMVQFPSGVGMSPRMLVDAANAHVEHGTDMREVLLGLADAQFDPEDMPAFITILDQHYPDAANAVIDVDVDAITEEPAPF